MLDEKVKQSLYKIIKEYGINTYKEQARLESLLKDYCGEYKKEIFMIVAAARDNIPRDIYESKVPIEILKPRLVLKIIDNLGFAKENAEALVDLWLLVLSRITFRENENKTGLPKVIMIGDYVEFGRYYGAPILWKCVNIVNVSALLVSEYILCQKAFDAAESGIFGTGKTEIQKYGSNVWSNSNIREWLNSSSQTVVFTTQPPVEIAVYIGYNAYADEPGFLSNFTQIERDKLKEVSHDGIADKVFLLSEDEVNRYLGKFHFQRKRKITDIGKQRGEWKYNTDGNYMCYWSRTPYPRSTCGLLRFGSDGGTSAHFGNIGVLPALYLQFDIFTSGKGTRDEPWRCIV